MGATTPAPARGAKLTIGFGLVNVGVKMAPLAREQRTKGKMLCSEHGSPIHYRTVCQHGEACETATGYEHNGGFVVLEDRKSLESARDGRLELRAFVEAADVDPLYVEKTYLLWPQDGQEAGYDLLCDVLALPGRAVLGTTVLNKATKALMLRFSPALGTLVAHVCTYDANIAWHDVNLVAGERKKRPQTDEKMLSTARTLFQGLESAFDFGTVEDEYESRLREAIEAQAAGRTVARTEEAPVAPVVDLMEALKASVAKAKPKPKARTKRAAA